MQTTLLLIESNLRRRDESSGSGALGCFVVILVIGVVLYFVFRGRRDRPEELGAAKRSMGSGPVADHVFACPYVKCPTCAASGDKMKSQWDGLRKVTWTCGYCGNVAGVQELKDEELPPDARQRLGLDAPPQGMMPGQPGYYPPQGGGGGIGGLLTGMMIGSMMGGGGHRDSGDWGGDGSSGGDSGGSSGGDWGDSGGGDSGDSGGGDSGGGDW